MALIRCVVCNEPFDPELSPARPFCSKRCREIDLGRWLREEIAMPLDEGEAEEDGDESRGEPPAGE